MLLAVGGVALRLGLTDAALAYVKAGLQPPLVVAGAVLVVLGAVAVLKAFRSGDEVEATAPDHAHVDADGVADVPPAAHGDGGHDHGAHGPAVGWLLLVPLLALLLIAPPPLGAFAASRQSNIAPVDTRTTYPPLDEPVDGAVNLAMAEFVFRALYDEDRSLEGQRVRLTGFVSAAEDGGYTLSRFTLNCCAADARPINVSITSEGPAPAIDSWLEVEGVWRGDETSDSAEGFVAPTLVADTAMPIEAPVQPYEY